MKRTYHPKEFKIQVCKEAIDTGNAAVVARRYELSSEGKCDNVSLGTGADSTPLETKNYPKKTIN